MTQPAKHELHTFADVFDDVSDPDCPWWVCPECAASNRWGRFRCDCGFRPDEKRMWDAIAERNAADVEGRWPPLTPVSRAS